MKLSPELYSLFVSHHATGMVLYGVGTADLELPPDPLPF